MSENGNFDDGVSWPVAAQAFRAKLSHLIFDELTRERRGLSTVSNQPGMAEFWFYSAFLGGCRAEKVGIIP